MGRSGIIVRRKAELLERDASKGGRRSDKNLAGGQCAGTCECAFWSRRVRRRASASRWVCGTDLTSNQGPRNQLYTCRPSLRPHLPRLDGVIPEESVGGVVKPD
ncbi:hypothetical protein H6P81_011691 [Aristolochia fimbriata]|uniref:Uncharacterized protein n=1 Tax=Aristolochia fimbriata TaxID=158543 RepID=A0AAV7EE98_ARIFI|nr:hypothetical protein H6P81_011691 [Aristolochia fimbriata]